MKFSRKVIVLCGAISAERDVSIRSGSAVANALPGAQLVELTENILPEWINANEHVVFPVIHGDYGEDGQEQMELEARGIAYAGCDATASRLCIDKVATKKIMRSAGVPAIPEVAFAGDAKPAAKALLQSLGESMIIKPADKGSSVGLYVLNGLTEIEAALKKLSVDGQWMAERRLVGREMSIGLLDGKALGIVEIVPKQGVYDYQTKYTKGSSEYIFPAPIAPECTRWIQVAAEKLFAATGCRDFARADLFLEPSGDFYFLEINTMPGMTETSLMPKSASCLGLSFTTLVDKMIAPALNRARQGHAS